MRGLSLVAATVLLFSINVRASWAADNELTAEEKATGWQLLFNGKDHTGWKCSNDKPIACPIEDGGLVPYKSGSYLIIHEKQFGDFILKCDVKMSSSCNSGIFFRVGDPRNPVQMGFEIQVMTGKGASYHDFGAVYELAKPAKNNSRGAGQWDSIEITCKGPKIAVAVNGETVTTMNCDDYTEPGKNPGGGKNKFKMAIKDFPRKGYVGLQDHGAKCWYKNIKVLELAEAGK